MFRRWQFQTFMWRYLRGLRNAFQTRIPTPRLLLFPFVQTPNIGGSPYYNGGRATTAVDAVNFLLSAFPKRWPLPMPYLGASIFATLTLLINSWVLFDIGRDLISNNELLPVDPQCQFDTYDYVIVGGGTAGLVVATRVANASRNIRVLLLEAGGDPSILNELPVLDMYLMNQPANTWTYTSIPQERSSHNCDGRQSKTTRGKMLGGSSSTNFMFYNRGNKEDFNQWAVDAEDEGWNYENVLPYFKKSEDYNGAYAEDPSSEKYHGKGGLLNVATHRYMPGADDFLAAAVEKGYSVGDYNGEEQAVFSKIDVMTQDGWRESVYRAFYQDTGKPPNLCIKKYAHVTRINFASSGPAGSIKAMGVTYNRQNHTRSVTATREVIVSAGAFGSPKLLLLSGIGPSEDLRAIGIPVLSDLPVGKNLQDHLTVLIPFLRSPSFNPSKDLTVPALTFFLMNQDGLFAAPAGFAGTTFLQSPVAQPAYPDMQALQFSIALHPDIIRELHSLLGFKESILRQWLHPFHLQNVDARLITLFLGRPKSVGHLQLSSADPNDDLIIDPNYLSHPDDTEALLYGFKRMVDLFENTTVLRTPLFPKPVPGCEREEFKSDGYIKCAIKYMSNSFYHHVGTCALGKVVDGKLRVKGIDGLRVIDASVIPRVPNANTAAATIMIGEKGADFIISDLFPNDHNDNENDNRII